MSTAKYPAKPADAVLIFPSDLGWMGVVVIDNMVVQLTFGHSSAKAAKKSLNIQEDSSGFPKTKFQTAPLVRRLQKFASGNPDSFCDILVNPGYLGDFRRRVFLQCRRIPYGRTMSYAELAAKAGSPNAARAVGNCMADNPIPLLIPCHRVVRSDGQLGSYSAPGGMAMKRRILQLESRGIGLE
jgi:methylated-DNA-[protein]-cysteine S-methyltransferase